MTFGHFPTTTHFFNTGTALLDCLPPQVLFGQDAHLLMNPTQNPTSEGNLEQLWMALLDLQPQGVIILTRNLKVVYQNSKAKDLSKRLLEGQYPATGLPAVFAEVCHRLTKVAPGQPLIAEYHTKPDLTLRLRANWLPVKSTGTPEKPNKRQLILLLLQDQQEALREDLRMEQKKYDLTEREAEIWSLLRQEYTYQDIAEKLQISLNTVKTHVKNVYAKRRVAQEQEKLWVL